MVSIAVNPTKTERTTVNRQVNREGEEWRMTKKLGSLLGDGEDVTHRKQLANVAFHKHSTASPREWGTPSAHLQRVRAPCTSLQYGYMGPYTKTEQPTGLIPPKPITADNWHTVAAPHLQ